MSEKADCDRLSHCRPLYEVIWRRGWLLGVAVFWLVLCVNSVYTISTPWSFTRNELLKIRGTTPALLFPTFLSSSGELLDILKG